MRAQSGQASLEYVALTLFVTAILVAGSAGLAAAGVPAALVAQLGRGLCIVRGGDCERDRAPCVVRARLTSEALAVRIAVLRLGGGRTVLRERLSDGRVRVTIAERGGAGLGVLLGAGVSAGRFSATARLEATASLRLGSARSWTLPGEAAADRLLRGRRPPPDATVAGGGIDTAVTGGLGRIGIALTIEDLRAVRTDHRTGERTLILRRRSGLRGDVPLGGAAVTRAEEWGLVTDARGRPLDLVVTTVRELRAGTAGRVAERETHLDLTDSPNLAAAAAFIRSLRRPRTPGVPAALRRRLALAGMQHRRLYRVEEARRRVLGAEAGAGVGLGVARERTAESLRLVRAVVRDPLAGVRLRPDCAG